MKIFIVLKDRKCISAHTTFFSALQSSRQIADELIAEENAHSWNAGRLYRVASQKDIEKVFYLSENCDGKTFFRADRRTFIVSGDGENISFMTEIPIVEMELM